MLQRLAHVLVSRACSHIARVFLHLTHPREHPNNSRMSQYRAYVSRSREYSRNSHIIFYRYDNYTHTRRLAHVLVSRECLGIARVFLHLTHPRDHPHNQYIIFYHYDNYTYASTTRACLGIARMLSHRASVFTSHTSARASQQLAHVSVSRVCLEIARASQQLMRNFLSLW
jgi:hypothetical protein